MQEVVYIALASVCTFAGFGMGVTLSPTVGAAGAVAVIGSLAIAIYGDWE